MNENDVLIEIEKVNKQIQIKKEQYDKTFEPVLTGNKDWNIERIGEYYAYATEWSLIRNGTLAAPVVWQEVFILPASRDFFFCQIGGTLSISDDPNAVAGQQVNNFDINVQMNIQFTQDNQYMFNDWIPINLILGGGGYPHIIPQWRGVKGGSNIIIHLRSLFTDQAHYRRLKIVLSGFQRKAEG